MERTRIAVWVQAFTDRRTLQLQWFDPLTGKRKTKSARTGDPKIADQRRGDLEADLNAGRYRETSRQSWQSFRTAFEAEHVAGCRARSQETYRTVLDHLDRLCRPLSLQAINERTLSAFVAGLRAEEFQPSSIRVYLSYLHAALAWGKKQKLLLEVPEFPRIKVPKKRPEAVAAELAERLLDAADLELRAYLLCGWLAGLRRNEAIALRWERGDGKMPWVDFDSRRIWLPAEFVKGQEDSWLPIAPELHEALDVLPRSATTVFQFGMGPSGVSNRVSRLARQVGVRLSMRALRRGFVCRHAAHVPAQVLQRLARHADIRTTLAHYANCDQAAEEAILGPRT